MRIVVCSAALLALILFGWPDHTFPDSTSEPPVTLNSSATDTSKVEVGAWVRVVYGLGYADPVSGRWPRVATVEGTIRAVGGQRLLLALEGQEGPQRIDLQRIHRLVLLDSPPAGGMEIHGPTTHRDPVPPYGKSEAGHHRWMVAGKLTAGMMGGLAGGFLGVRIGESLDSGDGLEGGLLGLASGYAVGAALGVSKLDPQATFIPALAGSVAGLLLGGSLSQAADSPWPVVLCPLLFSTMASEMWRKPAAKGGLSGKSDTAPGRVRRWSIGLGPGPGGDLAALLTMRF